jgi:hypothetical protein
MKSIPTSNQEWSKFLLFPFKVYSVLGVVGFFVWDRLYHHYESYSWQIYGHVGGFILVGYILSALALIIGGLIQKFAIKSRAASSSFAFGITDICLILILPGFFPA